MKGMCQMSDEKVKKEKKPLPLPVKRVLLQVFGFLVSILPLLVLLGVKWNDYTQTKAETISLCVGGVIALAIMLVKAIDRMPKNMHPLIKYAILLVLAVALDSVIKDLKIILLAAIVGEVLHLPFEHFLKKVKLEIDQQATIKAVDNQTKSIIDAIKGRV